MVAIPPSSAISLFYTSGSTGAPKGVVNTVEGLVNQILWSRDALKLGPNDRVLLKAPCTFDAAMWEVWAALANGAALVVVPDGQHRDAAAIVETIDEFRVTVCHVVPTLLREILAWGTATALGSIRLVLCGGEAMPPDLISIFSQFTDAQLINMYGPTEASIQVTHWMTSRRAADEILIGEPIFNTTIAVLNDALEPVLHGDAGELAIGGVALAQGYHHLPELSAAQFREVAGIGTMYLTGDVARMTPGGLEYLGRRDHQVKVAGVRIELVAIESLAREVAGVSDATAVALPATPHDDTIVVCFIVSQEPDSPQAVQDHLRTMLPRTHVPRHIIAVQALPETASGKVDRAVLLQRALEFVAGHALAGGESAAAIWQQVLGVEPEPTQTFFAAGGSSLSAMRLSAALRHFLAIEIRATEILALNPTLPQIEETARHGIARDETPKRIADNATVRPSELQRQLWTHLATHGGDPASTS